MEKIVSLVEQTPVCKGSCGLAPPRVVIRPENLLVCIPASIMTLVKHLF